MGSLVCHYLRTAMTILFLGWIVIWFLRPLKQWENPWATYQSKTTSSAYGKAGSVDLLLSVPIFLLVILASIYLHISRQQETTKPKRKNKRGSLWLYPILVGGPLGTVAVGELLFLLFLVGLLIWSISFYIVNGLAGVNQLKLPPELKLWQLKCYIVGDRLGLVSALFLSLMFFPITRGSVLLQLLDTSFEISVRYHIWIANVTMVLATAHAFCYYLIWGTTHLFGTKIVSWRRVGFSTVAAEICLLSGIIIWVTSIKRIRQRFFEVFYYTHHLYVIFILFYALHVGDVVLALSLPGIFLFFLDRYLRLLQSRKTVHVISARKLPSDIVQMVIAKHPSVVYSPKSVLLLNLPFISRLEWHPFSIVSTSSIESDRLSILIKCQQSWTKKLDNFMNSLSYTEGPLRLPAAIEGPYGPASSDFLRYEALILVSGGSGIAPMISILSEALYQHNTKNKNHAPSEIFVIWSIKSTEELCILNLVSPKMICPAYSDVLKIEVHAFVTKEAAPDPEIAQLDLEVMTSPTEASFNDYQIKEDPKDAETSAGCVCSITGRGNSLWQAAVDASALVGYLITMGLINRFGVFPSDHNSYDVFSWGGRVLLTIVSMTLGIVIFGGFVYAIWNRKEINNNKVHKYTEENSEMQTSVSVRVQTLLRRCSTIHYGERPDLEDMIGRFAMKMDGKKVGVVVCGPESMQQSVASACRHHTSVLGQKSLGALDYHSLSFNL